MNQIAIDTAQPFRTTDVATGQAREALRLTGVSKTYASAGRDVEALQPVDLSVTAGEFVCLIGPSGCGKSTLLSLVAGLEAPTSGTIHDADGRPVRGPGADRVLLFQEAALFPWLDVQHNVEFGLRQQGVAAKQRAAAAQALINQVGLAGFERSYAHQLSGGMRQRAAIARALALDPAVLLMDEPFGALDALTRDRMHSELEALWSATRKTVLFVTHNVREAVALGDRVLVFAPRPGRIVREFRVNMPRPRSLDDHELVDLAAQILSVLHEASGETHRATGGAA